MTDYPESGVKLVLDSADYTSAMNDALALAEQFDSLGSLSLDITANVDTTDVQSAIEDLPLSDETVNFTIETDVTGDAVTDLPTDGETIETTVDAEPSETTSQVMEWVSSIKDAVISTTWNLVGTGVEWAKNLGLGAVQNLLDIDTAVAKLNATTGETIPNANELISGIFYDDLGDSVTQVADLVAQAHQLGAPLDEATRSALQLYKTFGDQGVTAEQALTTINNMVKTGLSPSFQAAADDLTVAFQKGGNRAGDLLSTLNKNAVAFKDLGFNGQDALGAITNGLDSGFKSATDVANTLLKIKQNATSAVGNEDSDYNKTLKMLGIANPAETGKAWSTDFVASVIEAIQNAPVSDSEKQTMLANILGGKTAAKDFSSFLKLTPEQWADVFVNAPGAAEAAGSKIDDSLTGALKDFELEVQKKVNDFLSSEAVDLPGKITALKTGLQDALNVLAEGGDLSQALTVALKPIGFDDEFQGLESALGNFVIGILQAVAQLQTMTGHGQEAEGTQMTIHKLGQQQLAFDLQIANPDQVAGDIATAVSRGINPQQISDTASQAVDELVKNGSIAQAQAILDYFKSAPQNLQIAQNLGGEQLSQAEAALREGGDRLAQAVKDGLVVDVNPQIDQLTINQLQGKIDDAVKEVNPTMTEAQKNVTDTTKPIEDFSTGVGSVKQRIDEAKPKIDALATGTDKLGGVAKSGAGKVEAMANSTSQVTVEADAASLSLNNMATSIDLIIDKAGAVSTAADNLAKKNAGGDTGTGSGDNSGTTPADTTSSNNPGIRAITVTAIIAALNGYVPVSNVFSGGNSYAVNQYNNIPNRATADALGYRTGREIRGT